MGRQPSVQLIHICVLLVLSALAAFAFFGGDPAAHGDKARTSSGAPSVLKAIPSTASFLLTVDFDQLRTTKLGEQLLGHSFPFGQVAEVEGLCGFDPVDKLGTLAVAGLTEHGTADVRLGVAATGNWSAEELLRCAAKVIAKRGGQPSATDIGSFRVIRDRTRRGAEFAARKDGILIAAEGASLRDMIDATDASLPNIQAAHQHIRLRQRLGENAPVLWSSIQTEGWLERLFGESDFRRSPLSALRATAFRLDLKEDVLLRGLLECKTRPPCQQVEAFLLELKREFAPFSAGALDRTQIELDDREIQIALRMDRSTFAKVVAMFLSEPKSAPRP